MRRSTASRCSCLRAASTRPTSPTTTTPRSSTPWKLDGLSLDSDGFFVAGGGSAIDPVADVAFDVGTLENGAQTYLLTTADVEIEPGSEDGSGDANLTSASFDAIADAIVDGFGYSADNGSEGGVYFGLPNVDPGDGFPADLAARLPNGIDTDAAGDFFLQSTFPDLEIGDTFATPGAANVVPEPAAAGLLAVAGLGLLGRRRK